MFSTIMAQRRERALRESRRVRYGPQQYSRAIRIETQRRLVTNALDRQGSVVTLGRLQQKS